jgi:hypothetical protein
MWKMPHLPYLCFVRVAVFLGILRNIDFCVRHFPVRLMKFMLVIT